VFKLNFEVAGFFLWYFEGKIHGIKEHWNWIKSDMKILKFRFYNSLALGELAWLLSGAWWWKICIHAWYINVFVEHHPNWFLGTIFTIIAMFLHIDVRELERLYIEMLQEFGEW